MVEESNLQNVLKSLNTLIDGHPVPFSDRDLLFKRCMNEAWFSNTLAWLLDPKGSHKLGVRFANEFLNRIGQLRSDRNNNYAKKQSLLRWGKGKTGTLAKNNFSLKNASAIREFYLSKALGKRADRAQRYCDVAFLDLDTWDGLIAIVENKLFTTNRPGQLEEYYDTVEDKFNRAKVREYVYLTLFGKQPLDYGEGTGRKLRYWVCVSWARDITQILELVLPEKPVVELKRFLKLLKWLQELENDNRKMDVEAYWQLLTSVTADCLLEELNRLGGEKTGIWEPKRDSRKRTTLVHSSRPSSPLYVDLLPNFSVTVQSHRSGKALFEKIIFPFGANADQTYNLMDIAARDIYYYHFCDRVDRYLASRRRLQVTISDKREEYRPFFDFIAKNHDTIKILFLFSERVWDAVEAEEEESKFA